MYYATPLLVVAFSFSDDIPNKKLDNNKAPHKNMQGFILFFNFRKTTQ